MRPTSNTRAALFGLCLAWLSPDVGSAQLAGNASAWELVSSGAGDRSPRPPLALDETEDSRLFVREGRLVRVRGGEERTLATSDGRDTGELRSLALGPCGRVFVAAEHGLFLLGPDAEALDHVELGPGAPLGRPTSLAVDDERRIWLATDREFGPVDSAFFHGRALGPADGLPPARTYRVLSADDGAVQLLADDALYLYRPDRGTPPVVGDLLVDGEPWSRERTFAVRAGASVRVSVGSDAHGAVLLRYRVDGHHVWRPFHGELEVDGLNPGSHRLEILALDRDLNASEPVPVLLRVEYPRQYSKGFVLSAAILCALATLAYFVWRSRGVWRFRRTRSTGPAPQPLLSTAIALVFALQLLAAAVPHTHGWPFVGFGMYVNTRAEGDATYEPVVVGLRADGSSFDIRRRCAWRSVAELIDGGEEGARRFVLTYNAHHPGRPIEGIQVLARRHRLTRAGPVPVAPHVYLHHRERGASTLE